MSINQPKPRQIKLPFTVPRPNRSEAQITKVCGICRLNDSKYICPRCNIPYCSLKCFQNQSHIQCTEPFYRSTILSEITSEPGVEMEEKKKMIEMLRRFEDQSAEGNLGDSLNGFKGEEDEEEEDEEGWNELIERLADVDLENINTNELFHLLPTSHRNAFLSAIRNPDSEETRTLLDLATSSETEIEELRTPTALPWWEALSTNDNDVEDEEEEEKEIAVAPTPAPVPRLVLEGITPPEGMGKKLVYNAIAISIGYIHTLLSYRLPSLSQTYLIEQNMDEESGIVEIKQCIAKLIPFLVEARSTTRYENLRDAWGNVWDNIGSESSEESQAQRTLISLLEILKTLIHPPIIQPCQPKFFFVLSDIHNLHSLPTSTFTSSKSNSKSDLATRKKLEFYIRALEQLNRSDWLGLEREVDKDLENLRKEQGDVEENEEKSSLLIV